MQLPPDTTQVFGGVFMRTCVGRGHDLADPVALTLMVNVMLRLPDMSS